jgi:DNA mismatch endonuclease (patch repair protein)
MPKSNTDYWGPKLTANVDRDRRNDRALREAGWQVLRTWEHEDVEASATLIEAAVRERLASR